MGKSTEVDGDNNPTFSDSDPAKLLEAALLQMDGIIAGKCCYPKAYILNQSSRDPYMLENIVLFHCSVFMVYCLLGSPFPSLSIDYSITQLPIKLLVLCLVYSLAIKQLKFLYLRRYKNLLK